MTVDSIDRTSSDFTALGLRGPAPDFARSSIRVVEANRPPATGPLFALGDQIEAGEAGTSLWFPRGAATDGITIEHVTL